MKRMMRKILPPVVYLIAIPAVIVLGVVLWQSERYQLISMLVALLACVPFFVHFEKGRTTARELVTLSVMIALSVVGRLIFMPLPGFKPISALVIITGIAFGPVAGFITGSMSALVSNMFFGQGPWTPFQMLAWGLIGFLAGVAFRRGKKPHPIALIVAGLIGGVLYSVGMDIWTTLSSDGGFVLSRYFFHAATSLPMTASYAVSNVVFLLLLARPMLQKTERLRVKYGVFGASGKD